LFGVTPRLGQDATLDLVLQEARQKKIAHFATHGVLLLEDALDSFLALTGGALTARSLYEMDRPFRTNLVVLSACETALGKAHPDSIWSLSNGFLVAGANSVVSSLWLVPDLATSRLMTRFYEELKGGSSTASALRKAQLALLYERETRHPYWWSAFRLNGDLRSPLK
jgi:CHAT domain-containing protein